MSLRASATSPRTCSGDIYAAVPSVVPVRVSCVAPSSRASPKSITFAWPLDSSMTFAGLMSR